MDVIWEWVLGSSGGRSGCSGSASWDRLMVDLGAPGVDLGIIWEWVLVLLDLGALRVDFGALMMDLDIAREWVDLGALGKDLDASGVD